MIIIINRMITIIIESTSIVKIQGDKENAQKVNQFIYDYSCHISGSGLWK